MNPYKKQEKGLIEEVQKFTNMLIDTNIKSVKVDKGKICNEYVKLWDFYVKNTKSAAKAIKDAKISVKDDFLEKYTILGDLIFSHGMSQGCVSSKCDFVCDEKKNFGISMDRGNMCICDDRFRNEGFFEVKGLDGRMVSLNGTLAVLFDSIISTLK